MLWLIMSTWIEISTIVTASSIRVVPLVLHACFYQLAGNSHSVSVRESAVVVSNDEYTGHKCS